MITDEQLLAACRAGGPRAHRIYRRSVLEFRERDARWRREREATLAELVRAAVREVAGMVWMDVMVRRGLSRG